MPLVRLRNDSRQQTKPSGASEQARSAILARGREPTLATDVLVKRINLQMLEISKMHLQLCSTPLVLTPAYTTHGYCIYCRASLLTSGTIKECSKFLDALDWLIRTQQIRSTGFAGNPPLV